ncbi:MAG: hypothetical protein ABIZ57_06030 [Candidatus Limnocylindria bacterium]
MRRPAHRSRINGPMMVRLYDYDVPAADAEGGVPSLRPLLETLDAAERRVILTGLFKPERMPGTMERLTTLVEEVDISFANAVITLDNATRPRRFVAIDEAKVILDRWLPESAVAGIREWDVARLLEPYGDGSFHGKLLKRTRKQLRSVSSREALTVPFLFRRSWT